MAERRQHERHAFSATTEVVDLASGARLSTRAADLNKGGLLGRGRFGLHRGGARFATRNGHGSRLHGFERRADSAHR
jgi:hypothetical protein